MNDKQVLLVVVIGLLVMGNRSVKQNQKVKRTKEMMNSPQCAAMRTTSRQY